MKHSEGRWVLFAVYFLAALYGLVVYGLHRNPAGLVFAAGVALGLSSLAVEVLVRTVRRERRLAREGPTPPPLLADPNPPPAGGPPSSREYP